MPGTATEKDVIRVLDEENRPCELVEGTLVEKAMGYEESEIAAYLITCMNNFVLPRKLGIVTGESGRVYTAADRSVLLKGDQALDGGDVLPGFSLPLSELFARNEP